jgi:hypothetical protein
MCGTSKSSPSATASAPVSAPVSAPASAPASASAAAIDLTNTTYKPEAGQDGGSIIIGDWQEANAFNPYYLSQVTEANVASAVWSTLVVFTNDYRYARTSRRRPDARQRRRQGARRQRRRDDGHVDPAPRPEVVGRPAAHV